MKKLQRTMVATFAVGSLAVILFTLGLLSWERLGTGLYWYETALLGAWILVMYGTSLYYGIMISILYPTETKKKWMDSKWYHV